MPVYDGSHEYDGSTQYCYNFNAAGYCTCCGAKRKLLDSTGIKEWPKGTWFQERRALVLKRESDELSKVS